MLLLLISAVYLHKGEAVTCKLAEEVIEAVTSLHNGLRANVAKRKLSPDIFGNIPGSRTLFKLKYDCTNEGLAQATIGSKCKHSSIYMDKIGRAGNFIRYRVDKKPNAAKLKELFKNAVEDWTYTVKQPLSSDVVYIDTNMESFANFGCAFWFCSKTSQVALACAYDNRPKEGKPLYWANSKNHLGCRKLGPCRKVIKGTNVNCDINLGLCDQGPASTPDSTEGTTPKPEPGHDPEEQDSASDDEESIPVEAKPEPEPEPDDDEESIPVEAKPEPKPEPDPEEQESASDDEESVPVEAP